MTGAVGKGGEIDTMAVIRSQMRSHLMGNAVCFTYMRGGRIQGRMKRKAACFSYPHDAWRSASCYRKKARCK
jgi:hypothetical protein